MSTQMADLPLAMPSKEELPLFEDYLNDSFPCNDMFFGNDMIDDSPLIRTYSRDITGPSSPESSQSASSKEESSGEADSDVSLAIKESNRQSYNDAPMATIDPDQILRDIDTIVSVAPDSTDLTKSPSNYQLNLHGIPAKSRVETQIRLGLQIVRVVKHGSGTKEMDLGERFQWLKLPSWAMAKEKLKLQNRRDAPSTIDPSKTMFLEARVVKSTMPLEDVVICSGCVIRERKRAQRKKESTKKATSPSPNESQKPDAVELLPLPDEEKKILVFNCPELLEVVNGQVTIPTRVTCYCRHHKEKDGFRLIITIRDAANNVLASTSSDLVLITDDHKTSGKVQRVKDQITTSVKGQPYIGGVAEPVQEATSPTSRHGSFQQSEDMTSKPLSRRSSLSSTTNKKRKAEMPMPGPQSNFAKIQKVPSALSMTNMSAAHRDPRPIVPLSASTSRATSPSQHDPFKRSPSQDSLLHFMNDASLGGQRLQSPANYHMSRPMAPPADTVMQDRISLSPRTRTREYIMENAKSAQAPQQRSIIMPPTREVSLDAPTISRMIPAEGPLQGGIEITILGCGFYPGMTAMFGDTPAVPTHCWSPTTLVCILPPATNAGPVPLTLKEHPYNMGAKIFTYVDDTDRALMELALQVIGLKTTGRLETARDVAMRICSSKMPSESADVNLNSMSMYQLRKALSLPDEDPGTETLIIRCLAYLDEIESTRETRIALRSKSGHSMLHLAAIKGYSSLVQELLARGANANMRDRSSLTVLHLAAMKGHKDICAELLLHGHANLNLLTNDGRTAYDLASMTEDCDLQELLNPWVFGYNREKSRARRHSRQSSIDSLSTYGAGSECSSSDSLSTYRYLSSQLRDFDAYEQTGARTPRCRSTGTRTQPSSRVSSPDATLHRRGQAAGRQRSQSLTDLKPEATGLATKSLEKQAYEKTVQAQKPVPMDEQTLAKHLMQIQQTWMNFLAETSPLWLQKTLANANASLPGVLKSPSNLPHLPELQFLQASPITAFQAMLPQMPSFRALGRNPEVACAKSPSTSDASWLQSLVTSLGAPPSYAEATSATIEEVGTSRDHANAASTATSTSPALTTRQVWWQSRNPPLRSQGRIADMTPAEQRAQAKKFQKPADKMMIFFWLPCLLFFIMVSIGKAVFGKLFDLVF